MEDWKFDLRVWERFVQRGEIMEKDYQNFLRQLPDLEGKSEESTLEELLPKGLINKLAGKAEEADEGKEE